MICGFAQINPMNNTWYFFTWIGFEYTCLKKDSFFKQCPWTGMPWPRLAGVLTRDRKLPYEGENDGSKRTDAP